MRYYVIFIITPKPEENVLWLFRAWSEMRAHALAEKRFNALHAFPKNMIEFHTATHVVSFSKRKCKNYGDGFVDGWILAHKAELYAEALRLAKEEANEQS